MKWIINTIIFVLILTFFISASNVSAYNHIKEKLTLNLSDAFKPDSPLKSAANTAGYSTNNEDATVEAVIATIIKAALTFLGIVFLLLMIYGGYLWMTARGSEEQVTKAKNLITAAVIGLIIVLAAYAISYFVIEKLGEGTLESTSAK